jgi:hypothetical protein
MNNFWIGIKAWFSYEGTAYAIQIREFKCFPWIPKWKEVNALNEQKALEKVHLLGLTSSRVVKLSCATFDPVFPIVSLFFVSLMLGCFLHSILNGEIRSDIPVTTAFYVWGVLTTVSLSYIIMCLITGYRTFTKSYLTK